MTSQPVPPIIPGAIDPEPMDEEERQREEHVDSDGTPVGEADHREDIIRSGGDPDEAE